jgi:hypothetical protein
MLQIPFSWVFKGGILPDFLYSSSLVNIKYEMNVICLVLWLDVVPFVVTFMVGWLNMRFVAVFCGRTDFRLLCVAGSSGSPNSLSFCPS